MAHKQCLKKMRKHIWCDCINDDLKELKVLRKLASKYRIKCACMKLSRDDKSLNEIVKQVYGDIK